MKLVRGDTRERMVVAPYINRRNLSWIEAWIAKQSDTANPFALLSSQTLDDVVDHFGALAVASEEDICIAAVANARANERPKRRCTLIDALDVVRVVRELLRIHGDCRVVDGVGSRRRVEFQDGAD
jgi:hypothetical protein